LTLSWISKDANRSIGSWINNAMAMALWASAEDVFLPNPIKVVKIALFFGEKGRLYDSDDKIFTSYQQVMICRYSGNGVSQEDLQQKKGRERSLRCTENRASVHSFLGSCEYSSAAGCQCSSNSCIFSMGMGEKLSMPAGNTAP